jgi:exodeoxyribonuclease VII small subunit
MADSGKEIKFEEAFEELEKLVETLEKGECSLDEAVRLYEKGMELADLCAKKLDAAEKRLKKLVKGDNGQFRLEPME